MTQEDLKLRLWIKNNFTDNNKYDWYLVEDFKKKIEPNLPKGLEVVDYPPLENKKHNCFVFALGLQNYDCFLGRDVKNTIMLSDYDVKPLFNTVLTPIHDNNIELGDYIFYKNENRVTHAGIVAAGGKIISKWSEGPVIKHNIFAVNPQYGLEVIFYKKTDPEKIKDFLINRHKRL